MVNLPRFKYSHTILYLLFNINKNLSIYRVSFRKDFWVRYWGHTVQLLGSLGNEDGDGNENGKKAMGLY